GARRSGGAAEAGHGGLRRQGHGGFSSVLRALRDADAGSPGEILAARPDARPGAAGGEGGRRIPRALRNERIERALPAPAGAARLARRPDRRQDRRTCEDADLREDLNAVIVAAWQRPRSPTCASTIRSSIRTPTIRRCASSRSNAR